LRFMTACESCWEVRDGPHGRGMFATAFVPADTLLFEDKQLSSILCCEAADVIPASKACRMIQKRAFAS